MKGLRRDAIRSVGLSVVFWVGFTITTTTTSAEINIAQNPLFLVNGVDPRVMLVMSRDHQLYIKAYNDYSDLDGDGTLDTTYNDKVDYAGYFDSKKCYSYTNSRFEPQGTTSGTNLHHCSGQWSGNFLNWATMTRMDLLRKVLYGGYRSTDDPNLTVLERVLLPIDVHAFAKVFAPKTGDSVSNYTPYTPITGDTAISICNLTPGSGVSKDVNTSVTHPHIRVASGSWPRWAASEVTQCQWGSGIQPSNAKNLYSPNTDNAMSVRVKVCASATLKEDNCEAYGTSGTILKPTGLLQKYGVKDPTDPAVRFGLMTGSYQKNKSGGVLRRNLSRIAGNTTASRNEINTSTGQFLNQGNTDAGIINTLNRFRISSYNFDTHTYGNSCGSPGILSFSNGECVDWGNPLSEIYLEALRYLAGKTSATSNFNANDSTFILSLPQLTWNDPMPPGEYCANNTVIAISTGLNSFDTDELSNDLSIDATAKTNAVSTQEGISGSYLVGSNGSTTDNQCTAKSLSGLASAKGICPEVPSLQGGYHIAGLAYGAHTQDLRSDRKEDQFVDTYTIALAESLPRFEIPVGDGTITILPACAANSTGNSTSDPTTDTSWRVCSMTDLIVEKLNYSSGNLVSGSFLVNWEDSTWGNDYDMDGIERLAFCVGSACSSMTLTCPTTTNANASVSLPPALSSNQIAVTSCAAQSVAGHALRFGYTITGSTLDKVYLPILRPGGQNFTTGQLLPATVSTPTVQTHTLGASAGKLLKNPLWYTAKYGAFVEKDKDTKNNKPDVKFEWDADNNGVPDAFNEVKNPANLQEALDKILGNVIKVAQEQGSATAVTTNSTRLETSSLIYQAQFNSLNWTGHLLAFAINTDDGTNQEGSIGSQVWDAALKMADPNERKIFSYNPNATGTKGIEFTWGDLNASQKQLLDSDCNAASCSDSPIVNYLRGDDSHEAPSGTLRNRTVKEKDTSGQDVERHIVLGDIVNSDPWFVGTENFGYNILPGAEGSSYLGFRNGSSYVSRRKMIYVGVNDGMLHGFDATNSSDGGTEIFAYVPNTVIASDTIESGVSDLKSLTLPGYKHKYFVDGSPRAGDVYFDSAWHTVLAGTLGAGGKGIFALDVTDPDNFSKNKIWWEINTTSSPNASDLTDSTSRRGFTNHLGFTFSQPSVVRMADGKWAVILGNGYNSVNQKAVLYLIDAKTGHLIRSIDTGAGSATTPNGLSTPIAVDANEDRIVDAIYAGDLLGNLWKFDVSDSNASQWDVAFKEGSTPKPLFVAKDSNGDIQPITAKPQVSRHPDGGVMVLFGTGQYFADGDNIVGTNPQVQTFYGIQDKGSSVATRDELVAQTIEQELNVEDFKVRITSDNEVNYIGTNPDKGWFMDLVLPSPGIPEGERIVAAPVLRPGGRVVFTTLTPDPSPCAHGGTSWLMELNAITGRRLSETFDLNGDWTVDSSDLIPILGSNGQTITVVASGKQSKVGIIKTPGIIPGSKVEYKYTSGTKECDPEKGECSEAVKGSLEVTTEAAGGNTGRQSWRQLR